MNEALYLLAHRSDGVRGTRLRKRADTSELSDVWAAGKPEVVQGDVVLVLRINAEGESGFSYIRITTIDGFAEGFIKSCYLTLRPTDASVVAFAYVHRGDSESSTLLRKRADPTRDQSVWVEGKHSVKDGQVIQVIRLNAEGEQGFAWIRTSEGHEGFVRTEILRVRPFPSAVIAKATVHRLDGDAKTILRQRPDVSRACDVWVTGHHVVSEGESVDVLRMNAPHEGGFCWIESASGVTGFIRSDYVCVQRAVAQAAPSSSEIAFRSSALQIELDYACKAAAIKAFHIAIRSTSNVSKQNILLRDLWCFHIESFLRDRSREIATRDFSASHFAAAEDSLTDVLSEAFVLAVGSDAAVSASIIADKMAFLPKDAFFLSLVKFAFASAEQVCLPSISATRHIISALLLHDSDFAAAVVAIASSSPIHQSLVAGCGLSDDYTHIVARAAICLLADDSGAGANGNSPLIPKLFDIFGGGSQAPAPAPSGCDADCDENHDDDGDCLVCGLDWGCHSGHRCREGSRGSWIEGGGPPRETRRVEDAPIVLNALRMHCAACAARAVLASFCSLLRSAGELLLGRVCAQIVSADHLAQSSPSSSAVAIHRTELCRLAQVIAGALCPSSAEIETKLSVDSLSCALLNFLDVVQSQLDAANALSELASRLGPEHPLTRHCKVMLSALTACPSALSAIEAPLHLRCITPTVEVAGISQRNAAFAFVMEQEEIRANNPFLSAVFTSRSPPGAKAQGADTRNFEIEADTRRLFVAAASQPVAASYVQAVDNALDVSSFPYSIASKFSAFGWSDPKSSHSISGSAGSQSVNMNSSGGSHSIIHSSFVLDGSWQWAIEFSNHKGDDTWVGLCSQPHLDKALSGDGYSRGAGLGADDFSFGIHHKKGVRHGGHMIHTGSRWKTGEALKLLYAPAAAQLSFYRNDKLLYTADGVPSAGMYAAVSSPMGHLKFKTLSCAPCPSRNVPPECMAAFSSALNLAFAPLNSCDSTQFISIMKLITAVDKRPSIAHLNAAVKAALFPAASRCLLSMPAAQIASLFGTFSQNDSDVVAKVAEMLALQPLQVTMKRLIPLIKSLSLDILRGKCSLSPASCSHLSLVFERVSRGLFSGTLAAFNSLTTALGRDCFQTFNSASQAPQLAMCEIVSIPRWVVEDVDPVRTYSQTVTFGDHRACAILGLGWADVRVNATLHRISAVEAQVLWMLTGQPGLSNSELSRVCRVSDAALDAALTELHAIGALAENRSSAASDEVATAMGSVQLPRTSIHIGAACIDAVFWLCKRIKEANGIVDELQVCDACALSTGSSPAVVVSVVIDLIRRGIIYRHRGYLIAPAAGADEASISALAPSISETHSSPAPWQLLAPFERLVLVQIDETSPACHTFSSASSSSACVDDDAFVHDLMASLYELAKHSSDDDILAVSDFFQVCGSVISFAAMTVFQGSDKCNAVPDMSALSLDGICPFCLDAKPLVRAPCGHAGCRECFSAYFAAAVKDSSTPARALGAHVLSITKLTCGYDGCHAAIPLSFIRTLTPECFALIAKILSRVVIGNLVAGQGAFARCLCSAILVAPSQECEAFCDNCGRAATIGNFKRQIFSEAWNHHVDLSSHESMNWKLLNSSGNSDRIGLLRYKPCPGCGVISTRCGCDPSNIVCDKLERCPQERCDHMTCAACGINWCWVCSAKNSTESRCSRAVSERVDRKERFLLASNGIQKLKTSVTGSSFLSAPSLRQRVASRLIRQFFDGENHHSPLSLEELQKLLPRERRLVLLPRVISLVPVLPNSRFISWTTVNRAANAIETIPLPALFKALDIQSDAEATVALAKLLGVSSSTEPASSPHFSPLKKGDQVRRGPDWKWGNQDNAGQGVVVEGCSDRSDGWVEVEWEHGETNCYRYSTGAGGFDVVRADHTGAESPHLVHSSAVGGAAAVSLGGCASHGPSDAAAESSGWASGCPVTLSSSHAAHSDAAKGPLRPGDIGTIVTSETGGHVLVRTKAGRRWWFDKAALSPLGTHSLASADIDHALTLSLDRGFLFSSISPTEIDVRFPNGPVNLFSDVVVDAIKCTSARFSFIPRSGNGAWAVGIIPEARQRDNGAIWESPTGWHMSGSGPKTASAQKQFERAVSQNLICTVSVDSALCLLTLDVAGVAVGTLQLQRSAFPLRLAICGHNGTCVRVVRGLLQK